VLLNAACEGAGLSGDSLKAYMRLLDKKDKMPKTEFDAAVAEITSTDPLALIAADDERVINAKRELLAVLVTLKERGMANVVFDPTLVRGFDYYTGIIFEIFDVHAQNPRALFGGGRYDGLVSMFGGEPIPAVGFAIGDVTLMDFLETHGLAPDASHAPELYLGTLPGDLTEAREYADTLRVAGIRVFMNISGRAVGDQVREAVRRGIPYFTTYGPDEARSGALRLKRLATSSEESLDAIEVAPYLLRARTT
jgi:histidyl-tRNA synthetase